MGTTADKLNKLKDTKTKIKAAIEAKGVADVGDVFGEYPDKIASIPSGGGGSGWTGHADAEGLKAIGWTDDDIAYYQKYGVNWNEEYDEYHKVPQNNIDLYGVINENNVADYADILVYCPMFKITKTRLYNLFKRCKLLIAVPLFDTSQVTDMSYMFDGCSSLRLVPLFNTSKVANMNSMFKNCIVLTSVPLFDISQVTNIGYMFNGCFSLISASLFNINKSSTLSINFIFGSCSSLISVPIFDVSQTTSASFIFNSCYSLQTANLKGLKASVDLSASTMLTKESVLYMINNSAAESPITITLKQKVYDAMNADEEVQASLSAKPNVSLAGA